MTRIPIRSSDERNNRFFDVVADDPKNIYIESKRPRQDPLKMPLSEVVRQINEGMGEKIIIMQAIEP